MVPGLVPQQLFLEYLVHVSVDTGNREERGAESVSAMFIGAMLTESLSKAGERQEDMRITAFV
jgi:hypothetical protein